MKKLILLSLFTATSFLLSAQLKTPAASPFCKIEQSVGLTDITLEYSRPGVKGRTVFAEDGLVPFGKRWRTGANAATKITFSTDLTIEGKELEKGTYAMLSTPNATSWDVHFFNFEGRYPGDYKEATPAATVTVNSTMFPDGMNVETFLILVESITNNTAKLTILWADRMVEMDMDFGTDDAVFASIDKVMAGPSSNDYYSSAVYYKQTGKDMNKALEWITKSIEMRGEEKFWMVKQKSEIQAGLKDYKGAIKSAERSMELAEEAENMDYVKMNKDNIAMWKKMK